MPPKGKVPRPPPVRRAKYPQAEKSPVPEKPPVARAPVGRSLRNASRPDHFQRPRGDAVAIHSHLFVEGEQRHILWLLVEWHGYPARSSWTWETEETLAATSAHLLAAYLANNGDYANLADVAVNWGHPRDADRFLTVGKTAVSIRFPWLIPDGEGKGLFLLVEWRDHVDMTWETEARIVADFGEVYDAFLQSIGGRHKIVALGLRSQIATLMQPEEVRDVQRASFKEPELQAAAEVELVNKTYPVARKSSRSRDYSLIRVIRGHDFIGGGLWVHVEWLDQPEKDQWTWEQEATAEENFGKLLEGYFGALGGRPTEQQPEEALLWTPPVGANWETEIASIETVSCSDEDYALHAYLIWSNGKKGHVLATVLHEKAPQKLLCFYEQHLVLSGPMGIMAL